MDKPHILQRLDQSKAGDHRRRTPAIPQLGGLDCIHNASIIHKQNVTLLVCVEDTGIGIPLHAQEQVFTPFMQADSSTSRNYGGTGIGLSISKCLVELMGGQINFISHPQVGSTFSFTAAFRRCEKNTFGDPKKPVAGDVPNGFQGLKAIIVDEKPVRVAVTRYHLKRLGILVEVVKIAMIGIMAGGEGLHFSSAASEPISYVSVQRKKEMGAVVFTHTLSRCRQTCPNAAVALPLPEPPPTTSTMPLFCSSAVVRICRSLSCSPLDGAVVSVPSLLDLDPPLLCR
ncbi:putative histidine kinase 4 [Camellia lanceoleosa]|uniref:Histidine kinase 4 n=1 Tax=Camellia lanceoleosa TaxID=1840588 RepID=A0ACC0HJV2_9ERIC|nr:putative histidine kinase 4 [Camellia lanceoleosa]